MHRVLPPALVVLIALVTAAVHLALALPTTSLRWLGGLITVVGLAMSIWGSNRFAQADTNIKTFGSPDHLVNDGLFRWSRNPMYLGFTVALAGFGLAIGSLVGLAAPLVFFRAADRWYIPFEEAEMQKVFGASYDEYRSEVGRWVTLSRSTKQIRSERKS